MMSWFVNQLLDPEGQRQGRGSCESLEYQQTGSTAIKERWKRKAFLGRQNTTLPFQKFSIRSNSQVELLSDGHDWQRCTLWGHLSVDIWHAFSQWDGVIVSLSSISALNPNKWKWPLPSVMLRVWQTAWVWTFCLQSSVAVRTKQIIVSNSALDPNMPWPEETIMQKCGRGPSMSMSLKSGFKDLICIISAFKCQNRADFFLWSLLSCVLLLSSVFPTMFRPKDNNLFLLSTVL